MNSSQLENRLNILQYVIIALLFAVIVTPFVVAWWISSQLPVVSTVTIDEARLAGPGALCPGDPLIYAYSFRAGGSGVLVRDRVIWRITPPRTLVYSASRRFILSEPIEQELTEAWHIPITYTNPETDRPEALPPADYRMIFAISSPSRSTVVDIADIPFRIREDCN